MGKTYCAAPFCFSTRGQGGGKPEKMFFSFPLRDLDRLKVWVNNIGRPELVEKMNENPQKMRNYVLCVDHFDPLQLMNARDPKSKLIRTAIPTIFHDKNQKRILNGIIGLEQVAKFHITKPILPTPMGYGATKLIYPSNDARCYGKSNNVPYIQIDLTPVQALVLDQLRKQNIKIIQLIDEEPSVENNFTSKLRGADAALSTATAKIRPISKAMVLSKDGNRLTEVANVNFTPKPAIVYQTIPNPKDKINVDNLKRLKRQAWHLKKQNIKLREKAKELKRGFTMDKVVERATLYLDDGITKDLVEFQIRMGDRKQMGKRYPNSIKDWALKFYKRFPRAYRDYQKDLGLPNRRTLNLWAHGSDELLSEDLIESELADCKDSDDSDDDEDLLSEFNDEEIKQAMEDDAELSDLRDDELSDMEVTDKTVGETSQLTNCSLKNPEVTDKTVEETSQLTNCSLKNPSDQLPTTELS